MFRVEEKTFEFLGDNFIVESCIFIKHLDRPFITTVHQDWPLTRFIPCASVDEIFLFEGFALHFVVVMGNLLIKI